MNREQGPGAALAERASRALGRSLAAGGSVRSLPVSPSVEVLEVVEPGQPPTMLAFFPRAQAEEARREEQVRAALRAAGVRLALPGTLRGGAGGRVLIAESTRWAPLPDARAGGVFLAQLHTALQQTEGLVLRPRELDSAGAAEVLSRVDDLIRYYPAPAEEQASLHAPLRWQLELVERLAEPPRDEGSAPVLGGVFPEQAVNADGRRTLLLWASLRRGWVAEDLILAAAWSGWLETEHLAELIAGYVEGGGRLQLSPPAAAAAVRAAWATLLCDVRAWYGRFVRGRRELHPLLHRQAEAIALLEAPAARQALAELLARAS